MNVLKNIFVSLKLAILAPFIGIGFILGYIFRGLMIGFVTGYVIENYTDNTTKDIGHKKKEN